LTFQIYLHNQPTLIISTYKSNPLSPKKGKRGDGREEKRWRGKEEERKKKGKKLKEPKKPGITRKISQTAYPTIQNPV
jgi:hypothetical protein